MIVTEAHITIRRFFCEDFTEEHAKDTFMDYLREFHPFLLADGNLKSVEVMEIDETE